MSLPSSCCESDRNPTERKSQVLCFILFRPPRLVSVHVLAAGHRVVVGGAELGIYCILFFCFRICILVLVILYSCILFFFVFFVTGWWWAGLSLVARFAIGLFARWVSKAWWNVFARPFPSPEKKWPSHCLVRSLNPLISAPLPNGIGTLKLYKNSCKRYVLELETFHAPNKHFAFRGLK